MSPILGCDQRILDFLAALGVPDPGDTSRVIIDLPVDDAVRVYVTRPADESGFDVRFSEGEFQIFTIEKTPDADGNVDVTPRSGSGGFRVSRRVE